MKKKILGLIFGLTFIIALSIPCSGVSAATLSDYSFSNAKNTYFTDYYSIGSVNTVLNSNGTTQMTLATDITQGEFGSVRAMYGTQGNAQVVDMSNFNMEFSIDNISPDGRFKIGFMSNHSDYPGPYYGTGVYLEFSESQWHDTGAVFYMDAFSSMTESWETPQFSAVNNYVLGNANLLNEMLVLNMNENSGNIALTVSIKDPNKSAGVTISYNIPVSSMPQGFDYQNAYMIIIPYYNQWNFETSTATDVQLSFGKIDDSKLITTNGDDNVSVSPAKAYVPVGQNIEFVATLDQGYEIASATFDGNAAIFTDNLYSVDITSEISDEATLNVTSQVEVIENEADKISAIFNGSNLSVSVNEGITGDTYQYWIRKKISTTQSPALNQYGYMWIMAQSYTTTKSVLIDISDESFLSENGTYDVIVRVKDSEGLLFKELYGSFTQAQAGIVTIDSVNINNYWTNNLNAINLNDDLLITINDNELENVTYTVNMGSTQLYQGANNDITIAAATLSSFADGYYDLSIKAEISETNYYEYNCEIYAYKTKDISDNVVIKSVTGTKNGDGTLYTMKFKNADGTDLLSTDDLNNYDIYLNSNGVNLGNAVIEMENEEPVAKFNSNDSGYGIYRVYGNIKNNNSVESNDTITIYYTEMTRNTTLSISENIVSASPVNAQIDITATASIEGCNSEDLLYAFYREDASGWVLIKDYSNVNTICWEPRFSGKYNIQARVKANDEDTYEKATSKIYTITGDNLQGSIDINIVNLDTGEEVTAFTAGTPYLLTANYNYSQSDVDDVTDKILYKYTVYNVNSKLMYLNEFTTDSSIIFIPNKSEDFIITVRAIVMTAYGYQDVTDSITIDI